MESNSGVFIETPYHLPGKQANDNLKKLSL